MYFAPPAYAVTGSKNCWMKWLLEACRITPVHKLPDFTRNHVRMKQTTIMLTDTTAKTYQAVPALKPANTMIGTCRKAQMTPERTAVVVNEERLANSEESTPADFFAQSGRAVLDDARGCHNQEIEPSTEKELNEVGVVWRCARSG